MGIKVKLNDGKIEMGGGFNSTLAFVKSQPGRKYNPQTKIWTVPGKTIADFDSLKTGIPMDILESSHPQVRLAQGNHHTRYGNVYDRQEWEATQESYKTEAEIRTEYAKKFQDLDEQLGEELAQLGVSQPERIVKIAHEIDCWIEADRIQFKSEAQKEAILKAIDNQLDQMMALLSKRDMAIRDAKEAIWREIP